MAMAMFALATVPLILAVAENNSTQAWFADDAASGGRLHALRRWWDNLATVGPSYGYYPNATKTYLLVKPDRREEAIGIFQGTAGQITCEGRRYLGGALGSEEFSNLTFEAKVVEWTEEVTKLAEFARSQPHAAFAAFTHGLIGRWTYAIRVSTVFLQDAIKPLEDAISQRLIPALTGQTAPGANIRALFALPARFGGLGLINPTTLRSQHETSRAFCQPLVDSILKQDGDIMQTQDLQAHVKKCHQKAHKDQLKKQANETISSLSTTQQRCVLAAQEKGASSWLVAIPIERLGFKLHKGAFWDAMCLRYGWLIRHAPEKCRCGLAFEVNHVLTCRQGGFPILRHNELRDTFASLLNEVCTEVTTEPALQPLSGESLQPSANKDPNARVDIRAKGFWDRQQSAYFDVRVFHPLAPSYQSSSLTSLYKQHETKKRLEYGQRIREIDHGTFTPLVCTSGGGAAPEATVFLKRLASLLAEKRQEPYAVTMGWLRCVTSFCLLRSALACMRGSNKPSSIINTDSISEAVVSSHLPH